MSEDGLVEAKFCFGICAGVVAIGIMLVPVSIIMRHNNTNKVSEIIANNNPVICVEGQETNLTSINPNDYGEWTYYPEMNVIDFQTKDSIRYYGSRLFLHNQ